MDNSEKSLFLKDVLILLVGIIFVVFLNKLNSTIELQLQKSLAHVKFANYTILLNILFSIIWGLIYYFSIININKSSKKTCYILCALDVVLIVLLGVLYLGINTNPIYLGIIKFIAIYLGFLLIRLSPLRRFYI